MSYIFLSLIFFVLGFGVFANESSELNLARSISDELINSVREVLLKEIEKGGVIGAVQVCSQMSQEIIKKHQQRHNVYIRRISEKFRNNQNAPDKYELSVLRKLSSMKEIPTEYYEIVQEGDGKYLRYFKTITIQPVCLYCHGKNEIPEDVRSFLKQKYPDDKATGYSVGELRGAVSVKLKIKDDSKN